MSLFPACSFQVEVPRGIIVPGERMDATLVLDVPHDIPRADHLEILFQTLAWAGYGGGTSRTVIRKNMFQAPLQLQLPKGEPLEAGVHRYPFAVDLFLRCEHHDERPPLRLILMVRRWCCWT